MRTELHTPGQWRRHQAHGEHQVVDVEVPLDGYERLTVKVCDRCHVLLAYIGVTEPVGTPLRGL